MAACAVALAGCPPRKLSRALPPSLARSLRVSLSPSCGRRLLDTSLADTFLGRMAQHGGLTTHKCGGQSRMAMARMMMAMADNFLRLAPQGLEFGVSRDRLTLVMVP